MYIYFIIVNNFLIKFQIANEVRGIISLGPVTQRDFLLKIGLEYRLKALIQNVKDDRKQVDNLTECFNILVDKKKMGERFKFFALLPETTKKILEKVPVVGFT